MVFLSLLAAMVWVQGIITASTFLISCVGTICLPVATNTAFVRPSRHRTTHTHEVKNKKPVYSQLDYVLCKRRSKCLLKDARSHGYGGIKDTTGIQTYSDHKLVKCQIQLSNRPLLYAKAPKRQKQFDTRRLTSEPDCKERYRDELNSRFLILLNITPTGEPNVYLANVLNEVHKCAEGIVGYRKPKNKGFYTDDPAVVAMTTERRRLRHLLMSSNQARDNSELRYTINSLGRSVRKRLKDL